MLVRSGREPPVLWAGGRMDGFTSRSGDGKMLEEHPIAVRLTRALLPQQGWLSEATERHIPPFYSPCTPSGHLVSKC